MNSPFGLNAKSVQCSLVAIEGGLSTVIDTSDALVPGGNSNSPAKGGISLAGVYNNLGGAAASVTINVSCSTGGDTRTLANGRLNVVGVDSLQ